jgi:hypothetical protein
MERARADKVPWYREGVSLASNRLFRADTRALVGGLMLGAVFAIMEQFMERLDTLLTGGALPWFGLAIGPIFMPVSPWLYGFWAGEITGNFSPLFAVLTATNPIAPMFFLFNTTSNGLIAFLVNWYKSRGNTSVKFPAYVGITFIGLQPLMLLLLVLWAVLLKLTPGVIVVYFLLEELACVVLSVLSFFAFRGIVRSGVAE